MYSRVAHGAPIHVSLSHAHGQPPHVVLEPTQPPVASRAKHRTDAGGGLWAWEVGNENQDELSAAEAARRITAVSRTTAGFFMCHFG